MKRSDTLRCYTEREDTGWIAYCVDADVRAPGTTAHAARALLARRLDELMDDLQAGTAPPRPAPARVRLRYQLLRLRAWRRGRGAPAASAYEFHRTPEWLPGLA